MINPMSTLVTCQYNIGKQGSETTTKNKNLSFGQHVPTSFLTRTGYVLQAGAARSSDSKSIFFSTTLQLPGPEALADQASPASLEKA